MSKNNSNLDLKDERKDGRKDERKGKRDGKKKDQKLSKNPPKSQKYEDCHSNDISWWNRVPYLYNNATRVPFYLNRGTDYTGSTQIDHDPGNTIVIPSMMVYDFIPTLGRANDIRDYVNKYLNKLYTEVESKTSGTTQQFQAGDMGLCYFALSSLSCLFASVKRAMGCVHLHSSLNYSWPQAILQGLGLNVEDYDSKIAAQLPNYVTRYNELVDTFNTLYIPNFITSFNRHFSLSYNLYAEDNSEAPELYAYRPLYLYRWDDVNSKCEPILVPYDGRTTIDDWLDLIEEILLAFSNSDIFKTINSYMRRAMPETSFVKLEYADVADVTKIWVDPILNIQTHNMTIIDDYLIESFAITVDAVKNSLVCNPRSVSITNAIDNYQYVKENVRFLDLPGSWTDSEGIMEATRLTPTATFVEGTDDNAGLFWWNYYPGTEMVVRARIIAPEYTAATHTFNFNKYVPYDVKQYRSPSEFGTSPRVFAYLHQFKVRPLTYFVNWAADTYDAEITFYGCDSNLETFVPIGNSELLRLHKAAHASVWALDTVPTTKIPR